MITRTYDDTKWRLVPVEPTQEMLDEVCSDEPLDQIFKPKNIAPLYKAMLEAAPHPEPVKTNSSDESALREAVAKILDRSYPKVARKIRAGMRSSNWSEDLVDPGFLFGALKSTPAAVRAENEACAEIADMQRTAAQREREAKKIPLYLQTDGYEEIVAEERGERIASDTIAQAIRMRMAGK